MSAAAVSASHLDDDVVLVRPACAFGPCAEAITLPGDLKLPWALLLREHALASTAAQRPQAKFDDEHSKPLSANIAGSTKSVRWRQHPCAVLPQPRPRPARVVFTFDDDCSSGAGGGDVHAKRKSVTESPPSSSPAKPQPRASLLGKMRTMWKKTKHVDDAINGGDVWWLREARRVADCVERHQRFATAMAESTELLRAARSEAAKLAAQGRLADALAVLVDAAQLHSPFCTAMNRAPGRLDALGVRTSFKRLCRPTKCKATGAKLSGVYARALSEATADAAQQARLPSAEFIRAQLDALFADAPADGLSIADVTARGELAALCVLAALGCWRPLWDWRLR